MTGYFYNLLSGTITENVTVLLFNINKLAWEPGAGKQGKAIP